MIFVNLTENKTHLSVHVHLVPTNVVIMVNVVLVTTIVLNVSEHLTTVKFVTQTERTPHQPAHVTTITSKSKEVVLNVMPDVLLVVAMPKNH